jgi:hypothetical protein
VRIFGGHDYYDSAQAFGHDPSVVLQRRDDWWLQSEKSGAPRIFGENTQIRFVRIGKKFRYYRDAESCVRIKGDLWYSYAMEVIFCGMRYRGVYMEHSTTQVREFFWDLDSFKHWLDVCGYYYAAKAQRTFFSESSLGRFSQTPCTQQEIEFLRRDRVSIMTWLQTQYPQTHWQVNKWDLKEMKFFKVHEATQAFQKLDMWISSILGKPANEMIETSNEIRIAKHGFNQYSFRTTASRNEDTP